jgi:hypothetical protein
MRRGCAPATRQGCQLTARRHAVRAARRAALRRTRGDCWPATLQLDRDDAFARCADEPDGGAAQQSAVHGCSSSTRGEGPTAPATALPRPLRGRPCHVQQGAESVHLVSRPWNARQQQHSSCTSYHAVFVCHRRVSRGPAFPARPQPEPHAGRRLDETQCTPDARKKRTIVEKASLILLECGSSSAAGPASTRPPSRPCAPCTSEQKQG